MYTFDKSVHFYDLSILHQRNITISIPALNKCMHETNPAKRVLAASYIIIKSTVAIYFSANWYLLQQQCQEMHLYLQTVKNNS